MKNKPVGRPRLGKNKLLGRTIFFSPKELKKYEANAKKLGMKLSPYVKARMAGELL